MSWPRLAASAAVLAALAACGSPTAQPVAAPAAPASATSTFNRDFVTNAYQIILFDRAEGDLARTQAQNPQVRALAEQLVAQANQFEAQLAPIAASLGIQPPTVLDYDRRLRLGHMRIQNGLDFDRSYLEDQIASHQDALNAQEAMMASPEADPRLVALSRQGTELVRTNLGRLRALEQQLMAARPARRR